MLIEINKSELRTMYQALKYLSQCEAMTEDEERLFAKVRTLLEMD